MNTSESPSSQRQFNTRLGMILFVIYLLMYLGFVLINAFAPDVMDTITVAGLNLAIVYGFALIAVALVLALVYGLLCRSDPIEVQNGTAGKQDGEAKA